MEEAEAGNAKKKKPWLCISEEKESKEGKVECLRKLLWRGRRLAWIELILRKLRNWKSSDGSTERQKSKRN